MIHGLGSEGYLLWLQAWQVTVSPWLGFVGYLLTPQAINRQVSRPLYRTLPAALANPFSSSHIFFLCLFFLAGWFFSLPIDMYQAWRWLVVMRIGSGSFLRRFPGSGGIYYGLILLFGRIIRSWDGGPWRSRVEYLFPNEDDITSRALCSDDKT